jgi:hypothetical protein
MLVRLKLIMAKPSQWQSSCNTTISTERRKSVQTVICRPDPWPTGVKSQTKPRLPNEIQDHILDFLHNSKPTLKACALVCRAWVPTSRYHLFSKIQMPEREANAFAELFESPNCTIRHVKTCSSSSAAMKGMYFGTSHLPLFTSCVGIDKYGQLSPHFHPSCACVWI